MCQKMPVKELVKGLEAALNRGDGYIMGATGQDPSAWREDSWWFRQYDGTQRKQALAWRREGIRVWDCNGLAEGIYRDWTGKDINMRARDNYARWCAPKGEGMIPSSRRVAGAAVFWGETAARITHVAFLYQPVQADRPGGDWYLIEARGVGQGVVKTRLSSRKPGYWGWMSQYFDYGAVGEDACLPGKRLLLNGCRGEDVKALQTALIDAGYDCGRWGVDGDFGDATEMAVRRFQRDHPPLEADGVYGPMTHLALEEAIWRAGRTVEEPRLVRIVGGSCYVRSRPDVSAGRIVGAAAAGAGLGFAGQRSENGWYAVNYRGEMGWVSGKYARLE